MAEPFSIDRRTLMAAGATLGLSPAFASARTPAAYRFPKGFLWGAATAGHQVEGNNTASDLWFIENQQPTIFAEPSGDACNSFELWPLDLDIAESLNFNAYRFSIEWSRIEPEEGLFSQAMIDHYRALIAGCHERGLKPVVTFNHFTAPRWFSAKGGWTNQDASSLFARYCDRVARAIGGDIAMAFTFNEPNLIRILEPMLPPPVWEIQGKTLEVAAQRLGVDRFVCANVMTKGDIPAVEAGQAAAHRAGREAIKAAAPALPVGLTLAVIDDQAAGPDSIRDAVRQRTYGIWTEIAKDDDFVGVQNYERIVWGRDGALPPPEGADLNWSGREVWAPSLAGAVRYIHEATGRPILVSEHGVGTDDDALRARFIPEALRHLAKEIDDGVPVLGYLHWSLLDNFEWIFGYKPKFGLVGVDRESFVRTPKQSAAVLSAIAGANAVPA